MKILAIALVILIASLAISGWLIGDFVSSVPATEPETIAVPVATIMLIDYDWDLDNGADHWFSVLSEFVWDNVDSMCVTVKTVDDSVISRGYLILNRVPRKLPTDWEFRDG